MRTFLVLIAFALLVAACGGNGDDDRVTVFAAASLTDAIDQAQPDAPARVSVASTSNLARQIENGAPCDVFFAASHEWAEHLDAKGLLASHEVIATNRLVCVVPHDSDATWDSLVALANDPASVIAVADEGVPAGNYAREAFGNAGVADALKGSLVMQGDVRAVARVVASGDAQAGFVYRTDARAMDGLRVAFVVDAKLHAPIEYFACVLKGAKNTGRANEYVAFWKSERGRSILTSLGFDVS